MEMVAVIVDTMHLTKRKNG